MEKPAYDISQSADGLRYFFQSKGIKTIPKAVIYYPIEQNSNVYELSFGDVSDDGVVDFLNVSNNQDMDIVIGTVIHTINDFFVHYPYKMVYFRGSTLSRTRLYRAIIGKHISNLKPSFRIWGFKEDSSLEIFDKNQIYIGYLIEKTEYEKEN